MEPVCDRCGEAYDPDDCYEVEGEGTLCPECYFEHCKEDEAANCETTP